MADINIWQLADAARRGLSANRAYQELHLRGESLARSTFLKLYAEIQHDYALQVEELSKPLDTRPHASEIRPYVSQRETGFMQYVDVYVRDRVTGEVMAVPYGIRTDDLLTRADTLATALDAYGAHAERYEQQVLGATYTSTYMFGPGGA